MLMLAMLLVQQRLKWIQKRECQHLVGKAPELNRGQLTFVSVNPPAAYLL